MAKDGYTAIISHHSGETEDATIADFSSRYSSRPKSKQVLWDRSDRVAKYNQLIRIEEAR